MKFKSILLAIVSVCGISVLCALPAYAKSGGSNGGGKHKDITVTKTNDKSSPKMMSTGKKNSSVLRSNNTGDRKGGRYLAQ
jgi:hypothetical protein